MGGYFELVELLYAGGMCWYHQGQHHFEHVPFPARGGWISYVNVRGGGG